MYGGSQYTSSPPFQGYLFKYETPSPLRILKSTSTLDVFSDEILPAASPDPARADPRFRRSWSHRRKRRTAPASRSSPTLTAAGRFNRITAPPPRKDSIYKACGGIRLMIVW